MLHIRWRLLPGSWPVGPKRLRGRGIFSSKTSCSIKQIRDEMRIWRREWWPPSDDIHYPPYKCWLPSQPDSVCVFVVYSFVWKGACLFVLSFLHSFVWQGVHLLVPRPTWRRLSKLRSLLFRRMRQHLRRRWRCNWFFFLDRYNFFIGPRSDHSLIMSVTHSLTD